MPNENVNSQRAVNPQSMDEDSYFSRLFKGRLGRANYFYGGLWVNLGVPLILLVILVVPFSLLMFMETLSTVFFIVSILYTPVSIFYGFSFLIRRLHDLGHSGWVSLLMAIPLVNLILGLYLLFKPGDEVANEHGPNPKLELNARLVFGMKPKSKAQTS